MSALQRAASALKLRRENAGQMKRPWRELDGSFPQMRLDTTRSPFRPDRRYVTIEPPIMPRPTVRRLATVLFAVGLASPSVRIPPRSAISMCGWALIGST
jgi:hypothetical protein